MNSHFHSSIHNTPFFLMFSYSPQWNPLQTQEGSNPMADDIALSLQSTQEAAIKAMTKVAKLIKKYYDTHWSDLPPLKKGTKVWLEGTNITPFHPMKKLAEKRYGPFEILKLIGPSSYHLKIPSTWKGVHPVFNEVLLTPFVMPLPTQSQLGPPHHSWGCPWHLRSQGNPWQHEIKEQDLLSSQMVRVQARRKHMETTI